MSTSELLGATSLFGDLDAAVLDGLGARAVPRTFQKGEFIFHEGEPGDSLFVIRSGLAKVFVTSAEGDEMVLTTLVPPEVFGELSLIDGGARSASAEVLEPTEVLVITRAVLLDTLHQHPEVTDSLLVNLGALVRRLTEQASDLVFLDLYGRVAKLLVGLADDRGETTSDGIVLDLNVTQSDLARMVGGTRQSVNQILKNFDRRGYLELSGRTITLKEPEQLRRRAGL